MSVGAGPGSTGSQAFAWVLRGHMELFGCLGVCLFLGLFGICLGLFGVCLGFDLFLCLFGCLGVNLFLGLYIFGRSSKQATLQEQRGLPAPCCPHPSPRGGTVWQVTPSGNLRARLVTPAAKVIGVPRGDRRTDRFGTCAFADE
jgi:hypothetical protein